MRNLNGLAVVIWCSCTFTMITLPRQGSAPKGKPWMIKGGEVRDRCPSGGVGIRSQNPVACGQSQPRHCNVQSSSCFPLKIMSRLIRRIQRTSFYHPLTVGHWHQLSIIAYNQIYCYTKEK